MANSEIGLRDALLDGETAEDRAWDLIDALDWHKSRPVLRTAGSTSSNTSSTSGLNITIAGAGESSKAGHGSMFTSWDRASSTAGAKREPWDDMEIPNFPDLDLLSTDGEPRTSEPVAAVREEQEEEMLDLVTQGRLRDLLAAPMGMVRFREWVEESGQPGSAQLLQYYKDTCAQALLLQEVTALTRGLHATYFSQQESPMNAAFEGLSTDPSQSLPALSSASLAMNSAQNQALDRLYAREFKRFISGKITEQAKACLGTFVDHAGRGDLGEIFCIADPRQRDTPLVFVSDAFCELSEYPRSRLVGRNCRFLQGPGTDPDAVRLLREAILAGKEHTSLLLNYTRTGKPFWNLLNMIPLRNTRGEIDLFLGAQINVTKALTSREAFAAMTGMTQRGQELSTADAARIQLSEEVLRASHASGQPSSVLGQMLSPQASQTHLTPTPLHPTLSPTFGSSPEPARGSSAHTTPGRMQRFVTDVKTKRSFANLRRNSNQPVTLPATPTTSRAIMQDVEPAVRDHMSNFASVHSKLLVFSATSRKITYITPALLAYLGHPVRQAKDRYGSALLGVDILDVLASSTSAQSGTFRRSVSSVIADGVSHSLFAGLLLHPAVDVPSKRPKPASQTASSGSVSSIASEGEPEKTHDGKAYMQGLLHFTPVKDGKDVVVNYVMVVG